MPTYEYECLDCGRHFEKFHSMTHAPELLCPECGGPAKRLIVSGAAVLLKGKATAEQAESGPARTPCGRSSTCCGRETRCDDAPCGSRNH